MEDCSFEDKKCNLQFSPDDTIIVTHLTHQGVNKNGRHCADDIIKCIFLNENSYIFIQIPLQFVTNGSIDNISALVQVMALVPKMRWNYRYGYHYEYRMWRSHDDVIKWKHFPRYWPFVRGIHRSPVNSPHKSQWRGALMFTLICARINGWVNNREAGDLRRYRAHYDVIVMQKQRYSTIIASCLRKHASLCIIVSILAFISAIKSLKFHE